MLHMQLSTWLPRRMDVLYIVYIFWPPVGLKEVTRAGNGLEMKMLQVASLNPFKLHANSDTLNQPQLSASLQGCTSLL